MGDVMSVKLVLESFFKKTFVRNFFVIGGATAGANTIDILGPFSADLWFGVLVGVLLQIANACYWALVLSWASSKYSDRQL